MVVHRVLGGGCARTCVGLKCNTCGDRANRLTSEKRLVRARLKPLAMRSHLLFKPLGSLVFRTHPPPCGITPVLRVRVRFRIRISLSDNSDPCAEIESRSFVSGAAATPHDPCEITPDRDCGMQQLGNGLASKDEYNNNQRYHATTATAPVTRQTLAATAQAARRRAPPTAACGSFPSPSGTPTDRRRMPLPLRKSCRRASNPTQPGGDMDGNRYIGGGGSMQGKPITEGGDYVCDACAGQSRLPHTSRLHAGQDVSMPSRSTTAHGPRIATYSGEARLLCSTKAGVCKKKNFEAEFRTHVGQVLLASARHGVGRQDVLPIDFAFLFVRAQSQSQLRVVPSAERERTTVGG